MRTLVIGGGGFIGRFLVPRLIDRGYEVAIFGRGTRGSDPGQANRYITGDRKRLGDYATELRALAPDVVVDLILSSGTQARTVVDVFRGVAGRIVVASSMDVYRACGVLHGLEDGPLEPLPLTEQSKLRTKMQTYPAEQIEALRQIFGWLDTEYDKIPVESAVLAEPNLPATVLRLPMIYGPGDPLHRNYPIIQRMDDRRPAILFQDTAANWRSPRGYVENVAEAFAIAATTSHTNSRIYNVAERESLSELDWAREFARALDWRGEFVTVSASQTPEHLRVPGNLKQHWIADSSLIREEIGYAELITRTEAIRRTVEWERQNPPLHIDPRQFDYETEDHLLRTLPQVPIV